MAQPQYLVVRQPGAYIPAVGFVRYGQFFFAPPGTVPSRHFRAMNKEAQAELRKLKADLEAFDKKRARELTDADGKPLRDLDGRPIRPPALAPDVNLDLFQVEQPVPVVEESGLTLGELSDLSGGKAIEAGLHLDAETVGAKEGGKRAADK